MTDRVQGTADELVALQQRIKRLVQEKSELMLISHLMTTLAPLSGLESVTKAILDLLASFIGGENVSLHYRLQVQWHSIDLMGRKAVFDTPVDPLVAAVIKGGATVEEGGEHVPEGSEIGAFNPGFFHRDSLEPEYKPPVMSMAIPLKMKDELLGVIKFENMLIRYTHLTPQLEQISGYLALVLNNEISGALQLEKANQELRLKNLDLERMQEEVRAGREMLDQILNTIPQSVFWKDLNGRYLGCNLAFARAVGLADPARIIGKTDFDLPWPRKEAEAYRADDKDVLENNRPKRHIIEPLQQADGNRLLIDTSKVPLIGIDGRPFAVLGIYEDITDRHRAEEALRQREKMDAVGQLAGGIAHDFNNQLAAILGYAELLRDGNEDPDLKRFAENIIKSSLRSADLTQQLLAFSRKGKFLSVAVDIHAVINETAAMLRRSIDKRIEIKQHLNAHPSHVQGDPSQLQNAILNLALNARDAMPNGGEIVFATRVADLQEKAFAFDISAGSYIEIVVSDTGSGMTPEIKKHLFEPFFTTKSQGKGTGLGLASVFGTVKNHHGAITCYTEIGKGTAFKIYLPLLEDSDIRESADNAPMAQILIGAHILLVDDEPLVLEMAADMLRSAHCKVVTFESPEKALEYYRQSFVQTDLVILDMVMPRLGGKDLYIAMRQCNPSIKALLSSGYSVDGEAQCILDLGVLGFLQKPFQKSELCRQVMKALQNKPA